MPMILTQSLGNFGGISEQNLSLSMGFGGDDAPMCTASFWLDSVELPAPNVLRVRFTEVPLTAGVSPSFRADTVSNYTLTGAGAPGISYATKYELDSEVIDLYLDSDLPQGAWVLTVADTVQTADAHAIQTPLSYGFESKFIDQAPLANGAVNDEVVDTLIQYLNPAFRRKKNWRALMAAFAAGDALIRDSARNARDQIYLASATGRYLEKRAADRGVSKPNNTGISDELFRQLAISIVNSKLVQPALNKVLEV